MEGDDYLLKLGEYTKSEINKSISNTTIKTNILKSIVSKKKIRFEHEGFSLDLSYITKNIIAMGFPAKDFESLYRNNVQDVVRFFEKRHKGHYKVYNLCSEREYPLDTFEKQERYAFNDHEAPPLDLILPFCKDVDEWLNENPKNVVAIHCKAGKGRTGTLIICYLLYAKIINKAEDAMKYFGMMRTLDGRGVTIPSQMRYIYYFDNLIKNPREINPPKCILTKIKIITVPHMGSNACTPYFEIYCGKNIFDWRKDNKLISYKSNLAGLEFPVKIEILGDVKIELFNKKTMGNDNMLKIMFNTNFIPNDGLFVVKKSMIDYATKDKQHKLFDRQMKVELHYIINDDATSDLI
jgi:phosphatidylinositol-3,4,5-trisphosphate 3-phosphatase/dual-specificity protein phosphatase PTEN